MIRFLFCILVGAIAPTAFADLTVVVSKVTAQQRSPWNGLVDVAVTIACTSNDLNIVDCVFTATNCATQAEIPVRHITRSGCDVSTGKAWIRRFVWDAAADVENVKIDEVIFNAESKILGVQLWENGPYWAECNVGASQPEEYGYYFWWGDTVGYTRNASNNGWVSVKDGASFAFNSGNCPTYGKDNSSLQSAGYIDATGDLVAAHDAATVHLGAPWRMPTSGEIDPLISNCTTTWTTRNGVYGWLVTGKGAYASKSIFLPAAGYGYGSYLDYPGSYGGYWSSTPNSVSSSNAWCLYFNSSDFGRGYRSRYLGQSVRPLREFAK